MQLSSNWELLAIYYNKDAFEGDNEGRKNIVKSRKNSILVSTIKKSMVSQAAEDWNLAQPTDTRTILAKRFMAKIDKTLSYFLGLIWTLDCVQS